MGSLQNLIGAFAGLGILIYVIFWLVGLAMSVLQYYMYCVPQERIGKKVGQNATWMAYVPIARNIQRMRIADMSMWKLMFVGSIPTVLISLAVLFLVSFIFGAMNATLGAFLMILFIIAYFALYIAFSYEYNLKIATKFGYDKPMALFMMFTSFAPIFTYIIAFSSRVQPNGYKAPAASAAASGYTSVAPASNRAAALEGMSGMYMGQNFAMKDGEKFVIGRDGTMCHIVISSNSEKVSRKHCSVKYIAAENCYEVTDYSLNGTILENGSYLPKEMPTKVKRGTEILIGDKNNQFRLV